MKKNFIIIGGILLLVVVGFLILIGRNNINNKTSSEPQPTNSQMLAQEGVDTTSESVNYFEKTTGYYARPEEDGDYPGVVMIHEWWGLNDNIRNMADMLAGQGYQVLAVDLYHGQVATTSDQARSLVEGLDQNEALDNLKAAKQYLVDQEAPKIASLGWCFGGGQSMQFSLSGEQLDATVIYYGNLVTDEEKLSQIHWPVLGIFGGDDTSIPVASVNDFEKSLNDLGIENNINIYPGVGHAFANPTGSSYAPDATRDAWNKTLSFLAKNLKGE